jgi:hypothetical protein
MRMYGPLEQKLIAEAIGAFVLEIAMKNAFPDAEEAVPVWKVVVNQYRSKGGDKIAPTPDIVRLVSEQAMAAEFIILLVWLRCWLEFLYSGKI